MWTRSALYLVQQASQEQPTKPCFARSSIQVWSLATSALPGLVALGQCSPPPAPSLEACGPVAEPGPRPSARRGSATPPRREKRKAGGGRQRKPPRRRSTRWLPFLGNLSSVSLLVSLLAFLCAFLGFLFWHGRIPTRTNPTGGDLRKR